MAALVLNGDTSGTITLAAPAVAGSTTLTLPAVSGTILSTGNPPDAFSTATGSAPSYSARAWVNFNGTGTIAIRASGNVSFITDGGVGMYTVNFTTEMPDTNYMAIASTSAFPSPRFAATPNMHTVPNYTEVAPTTTDFKFTLNAYNDSASGFDQKYVAVVVFR